MTQVEGSYRSAAPADALWDALSDPERLAAALPDVDSVEVESAERFSAYVRPRTGLGITPLQLDVRITELVEPASVRILGDGAAGEHRVSFDVRLVLGEGKTESSCTVFWTADVRAYGVLGSVTQRVLPMLLRDQVSLVLAAAEAQAREGVQA
jgi:carbon monoxide dehydrogenase subunit G